MAQDRKAHDFDAFAKFVLLFAVLFSLLQAGATKSVGYAGSAAQTCAAEALTTPATVQNWASKAKATSSALLDWPNAIEANAVDAFTLFGAVARGRGAPPLFFGTAPLHAARHAVP